MFLFVYIHWTQASLPSLHSVLSVLQITSYRCILWLLSNRQLIFITIIPVLSCLLSVCLSVCLSVSVYSVSVCPFVCLSVCPFPPWSQCSSSSGLSIYCLLILCLCFFFLYRTNVCNCKQMGAFAISEFTMLLLHLITILSYPS